MSDKLFDFDLRNCSYCSERVPCLTLDFEYHDYNDYAEKIIESICKKCFLNRIEEVEQHLE